MLLSLQLVLNFQVGTNVLVLEKCKVGVSVEEKLFKTKTERCALDR